MGRRYVRYGWVEGEGKGGVYGPLLMKQKKGGEICFVIYIAGESFFFIYEVFVKQKKHFINKKKKRKTLCISLPLVTCGKGEHMLLLTVLTTPLPPVSYASLSTPLLLLHLRPASTSKHYLIIHANT